MMISDRQIDTDKVTCIYDKVFTEQRAYHKQQEKSFIHDK